VLCPFVLHSSRISRKRFSCPPKIHSHVIHFAILFHALLPLTKIWAAFQFAILLPCCCATIKRKQREGKEEPHCCSSRCVRLYVCSSRQCEKEALTSVAEPINFEIVQNSRPTRSVLFRAFFRINLRPPTCFFSARSLFATLYIVISQPWESQTDSAQVANCATTAKISAGAIFGTARHIPSLP